LKDGDFRVSGCLPLHRYLSEKYAPNLLGKTAAERAHVIMLEGIIDGGIKW